MYNAVTQRISVTVFPVYIDERSDPDRSHYFWAYRVTIVNDGDVTVQLLTRHWHIVDANGKTEEVRGAGVVGEQPVLQPGDSFEYTSGCPLRTPSGFMRGVYHMRTEDGDAIEVEIPGFALDLPDANPALN
jgi:ApaG protein